MTQAATESPTELKRKFPRKLWIVLALISLALILIAYILPRQINHLSDKDFVTIEQKMNDVYAGMSLADIDKAKACYNYKDNMGESLKCEVEMAGYMPAKDLSDLPGITEKFEKQLKLISNTDEIWRPSSGPGAPIKSGSFSVKDSKLNMGCLASVKMEDGKASLGRGLPQKDLTGKVALVLACGGSSRKPYFDMH